MTPLERRIAELDSRLKTAVAALRLEETRVRQKELEEKMSEPTFWNAQEAARRLSQEAADLKKELELWDGFAAELAEAGEMSALVAEDPSLGAQLEESVTELEARFAKMEFRMLLSGEYDSRGAVLSIHAGAGGTDANDWAEMLVRMYVRFAERQGFKVDLLEESFGDVTGYKSVTMAVRGRFAYGWLRSEHGVHRLVRISPFDGEQLRHTTFALVEVAPEFEEVDEAAVEIDPDDLRIDTYLSSGKGGQSVNTTYSAIRITHVPTGTVVSCQNERSQSQNKATAMKVLKAKLYRLMVEARASKLSDVKGEHKTAAWGNQIRSYVLHPYKMVKDHRTEVETSDTEAVLGGELEPFMAAYLRSDVEGRRTT